MPPVSVMVDPPMAMLRVPGHTPLPMNRDTPGLMQSRVVVNEI